MARTLVRRPLAAAVLIALVAGCQRGSKADAAAPHAAADSAAGLFPPGWHLPEGRPAVVAPHGMVASNSRLASEAGAEIMKEGGNAVDAAVATGFALAVTYPQAGNIGGGGFMVIRMADGRSAAMDYREVAPLAATRNMYLDKTGHLTDKSRIGALAVGVPGSVAGMAAALKKYGTMTLAQVMAPAIRYAKDGFVVDSAFSQSLEGSQPLVSRYAGAALLYPGGKPLQPGDTLKQPALARTLEAIAKEGPRAFYTGRVAEAIAAEQKHDGGIITVKDLADYKPVWREPVTGTYRGDTLFAMPPSSSGGVTSIEALNILETFPSLPPLGSTMYVHDVAEAFRHAFIDRNTKLGDPAFVKVPMDQLTSKAYAKTLADSILPDRASKTPTFAAAGREGMNTTHYSVVDSAGDAVSTTTTLNSWFGSGVYVASAGFFLNNEMDDFASKPGSPNQFGLVQGEVNAIAPGKRMLSAMSPTIVVGKDGKLLLVVGAAGGPTIITTTTQIILNVVDHHLSLWDAMAAPRIHEQAWPDKVIFEEGGLTQAVQDSLKAMGYDLQAIPHLANANAVMRVSGGWAGVVEPRATGGAVGY